MFTAVSQEQSHQMRRCKLHIVKHLIKGNTRTYYSSTVAEQEQNTDVLFRALYYETLLSADQIIAAVNTLDSVLCLEAC